MNRYEKKRPNGVTRFIVWREYHRLSRENGGEPPTQRELARKTGVSDRCVREHASNLGLKFRGDQCEETYWGAGWKQPDLVSLMKGVE